MARFQTTARTGWSPEEAFDYLADMRNARRWDPGVLGARVTSPDGGAVAEGTEYAVDLAIAGRTLPVRYRVARYRRPDTVVLEAQEPSFRSVDTVTVRPLPTGGAEVTYHAVLTPRGAWVLASPLLALAFRRIGQRAAAGLRRELAGPATG